MNGVRVCCEVHFKHFKHRNFYTCNWSPGKRGEALKEENGTRWNCGSMQRLKMPKKISVWTNIKGFFFFNI